MTPMSLFLNPALSQTVIVRKRERRDQFKRSPEIKRRDNKRREGGRRKRDK